VPGDLTRILSDIHFGDRASRVDRLTQIRPLADVDQLVLNGDTLDTRPGRWPQHTLDCRSAVDAFVGNTPAAVTMLTGNHDPDFSPHHVLALAGGRVLVTHGDIVFDEIVPWGRDAPVIRRKIAAALAELPAHERDIPAQRFRIWRQVAATIPQRHQSERHGLKYALRFAADTIWPPMRILRILRAWREHPQRIGEFARAHWPDANYLIVGHTHRPGVSRLPDGRVVINTGSFCPPLGGLAVDITGRALSVRRVEHQDDEFRVGDTLANFGL
jgi:predicted phosphodiesterase